MSDPLADEFVRTEEHKLIAGLAYDNTKAMGKLSSHRLVAYRCGSSRRCLLLDVVQFPPPVGIIFHQPMYRLSPTVNTSTSSESGRDVNTLDGDRRWQARTYSPEQALNVTVACDHIHDRVLNMADIDVALAAGRREVTVEQ